MQMFRGSQNKANIPEWNVKAYKNKKWTRTGCLAQLLDYLFSEQNQ